MIWWIPLALAVPLFFLWTFIHESWHAIVAKAEGRQILQFRPWPHRYRGKFFFGAVRTMPMSTSDISALAPYIFDALVFVVVGASLYCAQSPYVWTTLFTILLCPIVNTGTAMVAVLRGSAGDFSRIAPAYSTLFGAYLQIYIILLAVLTALRFQG